jgi:hypothetical protein
MTSTATATRTLTKSELDNTIALAFQPACTDHSFGRILITHAVCLAVVLQELNVSERRIRECCERKGIATEEANLVVHLTKTDTATLKSLVPSNYFN